MTFNIPQPPKKQDARFDDWLYRLWKQNESAYQQGDSPTFADVILNTLQFTGGTGTQGTVSWNADEETLDLIQNTAVLQLGQELQVHVKNQTGSTITNGTPVMATGTVGTSGRITVAPMDGTSPTNAMYMLGVATYDIPDGTDGKVTVFGKVRGLDTSGYSDGSVLYISTSTAGAFQTTVPTTGLKMPVAYVINSHANNGTVMVRVTPIDENSWESAGAVAAHEAAADPHPQYLTSAEGDAAYDATGTAAAAVSAHESSTTYNHLTSSEYTGTGSGNFVRATSPTITTPRIDNIGMGAAPVSVLGIYLSSGVTLSGGTDQYGFLSNSTFGSDCTAGVGYVSYPSTSSASYTVTILRGFQASGFTLGAGSSVTSYAAFFASNESDASNHYSFYSQQNSVNASDRGCYMTGTAPHHFNAAVMIGSNTNDGVNKLQVTGGTAITTSSGAALTVTNTGAGNSFVVNDANPDTTPFVIDSMGRVIAGATAYVDTQATMQIVGTASYLPQFTVAAQVNDATAGYLKFYKDRAGAAAQTGDVAGAIAWYGYEGTAYKQCATINVGIEGTVGTNIVPGNIRFSTTNSAGTITEAMRINSAQRLLIGTSADDGTNRVQIAGSAAITASSGTALTVTNTGTGDSFVVNDSNPDTTPFIIAADGTVLVGSTTNDGVNKLQVTGSGIFSSTVSATNINTSGDTTGNSATTNALKSATTTVNVSSATAPTAGQVLTATSGTAATWQTPAGGTSPTGVVSDLQFSLCQTDGTLNAASGVQTWCGTALTSQDVFTVAANTTYRVRGQFYINTGATTHTTAMAWSLSTATVTDFQYQVTLWSAAANTVTTTQSTVHVSGVASKVLNATSTAVYTIVQFEGIMVVGTGGTVTPQINFSANPTGTNLMKRGSWISFEKLGTDTVTTAGGWA